MGRNGGRIDGEKHEEVDGSRDRKPIGVPRAVANSSPSFRSRGPKRARSILAFVVLDDLRPGLSEWEPRP